jgi:hypothetical protein
MGGKQSLISDEDLADYQVDLNRFQEKFQNLFSSNRH